MTLVALVAVVERRPKPLQLRGADASKGSPDAVPGCVHWHVADVCGQAFMSCE